MTRSPAYKGEVVHWEDDPNVSDISDAEYLAQVIAHLTAYLATHPREARAYFLHGNAYLEQRRFALARDDYTCAIELVPDDAVAYNNRGIAYRGLGQPTRAILDYRRALALNPRYRDAYNNRGLALWPWDVRKKPGRTTPGSKSCSQVRAKPACSTWRGRRYGLYPRQWTDRSRYQ